MSHIPLQTGCSPLIVKYLQQIVAGVVDERDKYVALIWDEISLQSGLSYDKKYDKIIGLDFEDWGTRRTRKLADHLAITFYLRCLTSGNKMPVGYGFCENGTKKVQLIRCIKEWLTCIIQCGLKPVLTICDQSGSNIYSYD